LDVEKILQSSKKEMKETLQKSVETCMRNTLIFTQELAQLLDAIKQATTMAEILELKNRFEEEATKAHINLLDSLNEALWWGTKKEEK
jgi:hypothetical protein